MLAEPLYEVTKPERFLGGKGVNFFSLNTSRTAIFKQTDFAGTVTCPRFGSRCGTEDAPLVNSGIKEEYFFDSMKISPAALSLLN